MKDSSKPFNDPMDLANFNSARYSIMIGKLENSGKTALILLIVQLEKGKMVKNIMLPCVLD